MVNFVMPWQMASHGITVGVLLLFWVLLWRSRWAWLPFLGLFLAAGFLHASLQLEPPSAANHISQFASTSPMVLEGEVLLVEKRTAGGYRLQAEMHKVINEQGTTRVYGEALITIKEGESQLRPGQIVRWRSSLRRPLRFGNPGEFDYPLYLAARGIYVTAFIKRTEDIVILVNHSERRDKPLENLRYTLARHIEKTVPDHEAGLVQALLLGMRGGVSEEQRQILSASGVAHLFAISGLHFGLLALLLYHAGRWLYTRSQRLILWCPPQRILPVLLIIPLTAYLFLTGNAWATRRAFIIVTVVALLMAKGRRTPPFALLASVALCLLLFNPLALFQPGFQLSFAGVAGILAWVPCWQKPLSRFPRAISWPLTLFLTTTAATMATAPATLWHFHQFAQAGLLTNLIAIPLIAWGAVPIGLVSMAALPLSSQLADWGLLLSAKLVAVSIAIVSSVSQWPGLTAFQHYLTTSSLIILIGSLIILLPFGKERSHGLMRLAVLLTTLVAAGLSQPHTADLQVTAFSVGQGDATLVSLADDSHFLIDGGGLSGSSIDTGEQLIAPTLGRMGINRLQGVILTHNHPDHSSGLIFILQRFQVGAFYYAEELAELPLELQNVLQQRNITAYRIREGWTHLSKSPHQTLDLFAPAQNAADINERSVAVFAGQQTEGVLLTADLGKSGFQQLLATEMPGRVTLLKLPHHGSRHSLPQSYLDQIKPLTAFVSSGRNNPYGFPHPQTTEACSERQIPLFRTDQEGMLTFHINKGRWQIEKGRDRGY